MHVIAIAFQCASLSKPANFFENSGIIAFVRSDRTGVPSMMVCRDEIQRQLRGNRLSEAHVQFRPFADSSSLEPRLYETRALFVSELKDLLQH